MTSLKNAWPRMRRHFFWRALLLGPLSLAYGLGYGLRRLYLRLGPAPARIPEALVISVGNLAVGGTGKTPAAIAVGAYHLSKGRRVFFLSRGYGRKGSTEPLVVSAGKGVLTDASESGDEPALLATALPKAGVIVGGDRVKAGRLAMEKFGAQVLILDDGFQQRLFLKRDLDLLCWNRAHGGGESRLLPLGILREPLSEARHASAFILTGEFGSGSGPAPFGMEDKPVFQSRRLSSSLRPPGKGAGKPVSFLKKAAVAAFCGLAEPESFEASLRQLGADLRWAARFPDHHPYSQADLDGVVARAKASGAAMILTTEKDAQRIPKGTTWGLPLWILGSALEILPRQAFERLLEGAYTAKFPLRPVKK